MKLEWAKGVPKEVKAAAKPYFDLYRNVVPSWCRVVTVAYQQQPPLSPDSVADSASQVEYRQATIQLHGGWLNESEDDRERTVLHELVHIAVAPMYAIPEKLLECVQDSAARAVLEDQWRAAVEGVVCDVAEAFLRRPLDD